MSGQSSGTALGPNFARLLPVAVDLFSRDCTAESRKELVLKMHAAIAQDAAECFRPDLFKAETPDSVFPAALKRIDQLIEEAVASHMATGAASNDLLPEIVQTLDKAFRQRFDEIAISMTKGGRA